MALLATVSSTVRREHHWRATSACRPTHVHTPPNLLEQLVLGHQVAGPYRHDFPPHHNVSLVAQMTRSAATLIRYLHDPWIVMHIRPKYIP